MALEEMVRTMWAIHTGTKAGGFLSIYMFGRHEEQPVEQSGFATATFRNRQLAQESLDDILGKGIVTFPEARVVQIKVTLEEV